MNYIDIKSNKAYTSINTKELQLRGEKKKNRVSQAMVVHPSNPSTSEAAAPGQLGLHRG